MKKILEILKLIFQKIYSIIQWTKKLYFFHFLIVYLLPFNLMVIIAILLTPLFIFASLFDNSIEPISNPLLYIISPVAALLFLMLFDLVFAIIFSLIFQIIMMLVQYIKARSILVNSKFLLSNKIYDKFYCYSVILIIYSLLCLYLWIEISD